MKEIYQLESILQILANNTNYTADIESLETIINMVVPGNDLENLVEDTRAIFKQPLIKL